MKNKEELEKVNKDCVALVQAAPFSIDGERALDAIDRPFNATCKKIGMDPILKIYSMKKRFVMYGNNQYSYKDDLMKKIKAYGVQAIESKKFKPFDEVIKDILEMIDNE